VKHPARDVLDLTSGQPHAMNGGAPTPTGRRGSRFDCGGLAGDPASQFEHGGGCRVERPPHHFISFAGGELGVLEAAPRSAAIVSLEASSRIGPRQGEIDDVVGLPAWRDERQIDLALVALES